MHNNNHFQNKRLILNGEYLQQKHRKCLEISVIFLYFLNMVTKYQKEILRVYTDQAHYIRSFTQKDKFACQMTEPISKVTPLLSSGERFRILSSLISSSSCSKLPFNAATSSLSRLQRSVRNVIVSTSLYFKCWENFSRARIMAGSSLSF